MDRYILDENLQPVKCSDIDEWAKWMDNLGSARKIVGTQINSVYISTVFLGLDHRFGNGPPILFETMVFGGELDQEQDRYSTVDEAIEGHKQMVVRVKKTESSFLYYIIQNLINRN